jgi:hypothetical protein
MQACCLRAARALRGGSVLSPRPAPAAELLTSRRCHVADAGARGSTVDPQETAKFEADADHWCVRVRASEAHVASAAETAGVAGGTRSAGPSHRCTR